MIESYKKILEFETLVSDRLKQEKKMLDKIRMTLYKDKTVLMNKLVNFLKKNLQIDYYIYNVKDFDGNKAEILVKKDSFIFEEFLKDKEYIEFNVEELIDNRIFDNKDEIIIVDINSDDTVIGLKYLCKSLDYLDLSYSELVKEQLASFVDYIVCKNG